MEFDFDAIGAELRYKLLVSFVGPRPIALVTTQSPSGVGNAAPMSFFNVFAQSPPLLILGIQDREGARKDTTRNVLATREFVVNLVDEPIARQMVVCAVEFPPDVDEVRVTVTPKGIFEVSRRIREEFENGRDYYRLHGRSIDLPTLLVERPDHAALEWHNGN